MERNAQGNPVLKFDINETQHVGEIFGRLLGFQPARLTQQWDRIHQESDAKAYWTTRHDLLVRQLWHTIQRKDDVAKDRTLSSIKNFNNELPDEARGYKITSESLQRSFKQRALIAKKQEMGIPLQKRDIPLVQDIQRLHPGAEPIGRQVVE
jgi:hypothetical protein